MSLSSKMPDGRTIYGAAAQQHIIKDNGGWEEHHSKFAKFVVDTVIKCSSMKNFTFNKK